MPIMSGRFIWGVRCGREFVWYSEIDSCTYSSNSFTCYWWYQIALKQLLAVLPAATQNQDPRPWRYDLMYQGWSWRSSQGMDLWLMEWRWDKRIMMEEEGGEKNWCIEAGKVLHLRYWTRSFWFIKLNGRSYQLFLDHWVYYDLETTGIVSKYSPPKLKLLIVGHIIT